MQAAKKRFGLGGEAQHLEAVAIVQVGDAKLKGFLSLLEFVAGHRARGVDDKGDVLLSGLAFGGVHARRGEHQEITFIAFAMGDDVDVDVLLFGRIKEREVGGGPLAFAFKGNHCILGALALHPHIVRGRVDGFHRYFGIELHLDGQIFNRFGGILGGV